jgi:hypothetical protein
MFVNYGGLVIYHDFEILFIVNFWKYTILKLLLTTVINGELRLAGVSITGESFWTPGSHFTDFKEHTTIFKGSIILKIIRRLL